MHEEQLAPLLIHDGPTGGALAHCQAIEGHEIRSLAADLHGLTQISREANFNFFSYPRGSAKIPGWLFSWSSLFLRHHDHGVLHAVVIVFRVWVGGIEQPVAIDNKLVGVLARFEIDAADPLITFTPKDILRLTPVVERTRKRNDAGVRIALQFEGRVSLDRKSVV